MGGNLTSKTGVGTYNYTDASSPQQITSITASNGSVRNFSYDPDGNLTNDGVHVNTFDALNRVTQVVDSSAGSAVQFAYTPAGARYQEATSVGAATTTLTEVNPLFEMQYSSATGHTDYRESIVGGGSIVAIRTVRDDGVLTTRYLTSNHLGGVSVISDEVGTVDERMSYDAFGQRRDPSNWQPYTTMPDLTDITDKGYTGQQQLDAVGLIHMNGRVYDPQIGRFISADPTVPDPLYSQSFNRYAYVYNNPLSATDPSGFQDIGVYLEPPPVQVLCQICQTGPSQLGSITVTGPNLMENLPTLPATDVPLPAPVSAASFVNTAAGTGASSATAGNGNNGGDIPGSLPQLPDNLCEAGTNCGGNNGVQQAMNDTNGVQQVQGMGDVDWASMGGSGKIGLGRGFGAITPIPALGKNIGGPAAGLAKFPGSGGVPIAYGGLNHSVVILYPTGLTELRQGGSRSWRNNNPGNVRLGGPRSPVRPYAIGVAGGFAVFPDAATGRTALGSLLMQPYYQGLSVNAAISQYAPRVENNTENYQNFIKNALGVPGVTLLENLNATQFGNFMNAIQEFEGWEEGIATYSQGGPNP